MKHSVILLLAASSIGWIGWRLAGSGAENSTAFRQKDERALKAPFQVIRDKELIFERAFWKRPGVFDEILHAERREWADADGLQRWQWFIVARPSEDLVRHLRANNAFGLASESHPPTPEDAPDWFHFDADHAEIMKAPGGRMTLAFVRDGLLHGTDSGGGFHQGKPASDIVLQTESAPSGRLPLSPPPAP